jgi:patatin-like phospholipase
MCHSDSRNVALGIKHIIASGALPPAFPAVRIDGELYWDGGILSNTPRGGGDEDLGEIRRSHAPFDTNRRIHQTRSAVAERSGQLERVSSASRENLPTPTSARLSTASITAAMPCKVKPP